MLQINMQKKWSKTVVVLSIFIVQIIIYSILFSFQQVNDFIIHHITFPISGFIARITNAISFPVGELFYLFLAFIGIYFLVRLIKISFKKREKLPQLLTQILIFVNVIYFVYMFAWGIMYKKETLTFDSKEIKIDPKILKTIYCDELNKAIYSRNLIKHSSEKTVQFELTLNDYNAEFFKLQVHLKELNWLKNYRFLEHAHYKLSNISMMQNYLGILGYYNPFSVEANLNRYNTNLKQPSTMFHEYGHQMGFASESEANFLAYYLGSKSKNPEINYAIYYKSIYSLLGAIYKSDPYFVKMELDNMHPKIVADRKAEIDYYAKYEGKTSDTFSELNNQFLKANDQEGTISYSKYVELIYYLHQTKKGTE